MLNRIRATRLWQAVLAPLLFFTAATVLMTWPLASRLQTAVIGSRNGDNWYYVWLIGWFQKALFEKGQSPLVVPFLNYPVGWNLAYSEITLSNVIPALPVSLLGGPMLAYNTVCILSFVLSGLVVHLWVASLTKNYAAGLVSGALFAFAPYRLAHLYGHLPLLGTQYLALHYAGLYYLLQQRAVNWKYAAMAGTGLGLAALSSMYYLYMTLVISAIFAGGYFLFVDRRAIFRSVSWKNLSALALIALPFLLAAVWPYFQLSKQGNANHRALSEVDMWSASLPDFFLPAPVHFLWGDWVAERFDRSIWIEQTIYLGAATLFLAAIAWIRRRSAPENAWTVNLLTLGMVCAAILALGTTLHWFREQVTVAVPEVFLDFVDRARTPIYLPNYWLYRFLPFYDGMRAWSRYGVYANLFGAVLAGIGLGWLLKALRWRWLATVLPVSLLALIGIDFYIAPYPLSEVKARPVDLWLADQSAEGAMVQFPIERSLQPELLYPTLASERPFLGMFYGAYLPPAFEQTYKKFAGFPSQESIALARERGADYIIVEAARYPDWPATRRQILSFGLEEVAVIDGQHVFRAKRQ
jgi:hypothetical protein